jgi:hypothetical protein
MFSRNNQAVRAAARRRRPPSECPIEWRSRLVEKNPVLVADLVALTNDDDWLVSQRALDLLEKFAHDHPEWVEPHKHVFIGPLAESDKCEVRLQIVRALPLFVWAVA